MRVLVTGGTGLLSGPVARRLAQRGAEVTIFHRTRSGGDDQLGELIGDRANYPEFVWKVRETGPWDCVVEMLGGSEGDAQSLAEAVDGCGTHVIFCSTTTVYGRPFARVPVVEADALLDPPSPYGAGKLACERALRSVEACSDAQITIIRPAHIYHERSLVLHSLGNRTSHLDRIRQGRPIVVHDDGEGAWSSLWADDAAKAFVGAVFEPVAKGRTYHLAGANPFTWNEYHRWLASGLDAPEPEFRHIPTDQLGELAPDRTLQLRRTLRYPGIYDCSAARRDLGFCPSVAPADGLIRNVRALVEAGRIESWSEDPEYERVVQSC